MQKKLIFACAIILASTFISCKKEDENNTTNTGNAMEFKLDHFWGNTYTTGFTLNKNYYHTKVGDSIQFSMLKYYVTNIELEKLDGTFWKESESYHLIDASKGQMDKFDIKNIPSGEYKSIKFKIGVDSTRNVSGAQTGALAVENGMFWSWNTGYIFVRAEGSSPKITDNNGNFVYHLGGFKQSNNAVRELSFDFDNILSVSSSAKPSMHFKVNVAIFWHDTDITTIYKVHMPGENAQKLADLFSEGIILDHTHR
jgi:hypothetical protein